MNLIYNIIVKPKELNKTIIQSLSFKKLYISNVSFELDVKNFEIKLIGKGELLNVNESILVYKTDFNLTNMSNNIFEAPNIILEIKYVGSDNKNVYNVKTTFTYQEYNPRLLYCNMYNSLDQEGILNIISDIKKIINNNNATNILFTSDKNLNNIKFYSKFVCKEEDILEKYDIASVNNLINFQCPDFFEDYIDNYVFDVDIDQSGKLGVNIYGY